MKTLSYRHTQYASFLGYITQAVVNNLTPLLFLIFQQEWQLPLQKITFLITANFCIQLAVDFLAARFVDRIGYRRCIVAAHLFSAAGLIGLALLPELLSPYPGLLAAVSLYAIGGGLIEVLISPIVEACPTDNKASVMSLLHSFYCWGTVGVIVISTGFLFVCGKESWRLLAGLWAILPLGNALFFLRVPIAQLAEDGGAMPLGQLLKSKFFWLFVLLMVASGASEQSMAQWASAFAEKSLGISKALGDLAGPCLFSVLMGTARALSARYAGRIDLIRLISCSAAGCIACYLLAGLAQSTFLSLLGCILCGLTVGVFWPGVFSTASARLPRGGTPMFAYLALAGDLGCSGGPTLVGTAAGLLGDNLKLGLLCAVIFPVILILGCFVLKKSDNCTAAQ